MTTANHDELIPVRNPVEQFVLAWSWVLIPAVYTLRLAVQYLQSPELPYALRDTVKIASELAIVLILTLARECFAAIRPTLASLFANGVVSRPVLTKGGPDGTLAGCKWALDRALNHPARMLLGALIASITLAYYLSRPEAVTGLRRPGSLLNLLDVVLYLVPTICYAYFLGVVLWKLIATSRFFQFFPERYVLTPRFLHPDGACGCLPLGGLCLRIMYVAVIPTALSGIFLLAHFAPQGLMGYLSPNRILLVRFTPPILGLGIIGLVIGFLPLLRFHVAIMGHCDEWTEELKMLSERIIAEKASILHPPENLKEFPIETVLKTVTELESRYAAFQAVRTWPVDRMLVARMWSSVVLLGGQVLGLLEAARRVW